ncbi:hypothetical protein [Bordetella sp. 02P26C-1]|uniref:hypothetical protein n=1 Tax=Bordetella sp. 02P26C-1 TaxID=2683195 RepID=UPI0013527CB7|nr:hypothetical protein [Bordetella sp. 02P26C-1]MVW80202.1 hypothetical protein [Bordetella sp. 02P26C-1]
MLDSSFLISLSTDERPEHLVAKRYYMAFIERGVPMFLSTIAVCEYEVRQRVDDLGLENFLILPFNIDDAIQGASLFGRMHAARTESDDRVAVKDDAKLLGQCVLAGISHFATSDTKCVNRLNSLRKSGAVTGLPLGINIRDAFSTLWFNENNQVGFFDLDEEQN